MTVKKFIKAFIAGMALPAVFLPIAYTILYLNVHPVSTHALQFIPMFLPLAWGLANAIYAQLQEESSSKKSQNGGLIITGACLGFLVAAFGVFVVHIPNVIFGHVETFQYAPLIILPVIYAILFRYIVKWINKLVGV